MTPFHTLPLIVAVLLIAGGSIFLLEKAERQTRDTTRKHHLEDIEQSLYFAQKLRGTYPPYDQTSWCGFINAEENRNVRDEMEEALRAQHEKYANPDKPYPTDPLAEQDYFYWKRSPSSFELYANLEYERTGDRTTAGCANAPRYSFDYGLSSILRQQKTTVVSSPL